MMEIVPGTDDDGNGRFMESVDERERLERTVDMLRYSIENAEMQLTMYKEGDLEWIYARKIIDSCKETLSTKEKELEVLLKKEEKKGDPTT